MIDTDKYEGHDTGWKAHFFEDGSIAIGGVCKLLTEETGHKTRKMIEANALLIADAPLLLEEIKRLRKALYWVAVEETREDVEYMWKGVDEILADDPRWATKAKEWDYTKRDWTIDRAKEE